MIHNEYQHEKLIANSCKRTRVVLMQTQTAIFGQYNKSYLATIHFILHVDTISHKENNTYKHLSKEAVSASCDQNCLYLNIYF